MCLLNVQTMSSLNSVFLIKTLLRIRIEYPANSIQRLEFKVKVLGSPRHADTFRAGRDVNILRKLVVNKPTRSIQMTRG